jgi:hypothetical protein
MRLRRFATESALACVVSSLMLPGAIAAATIFLFLTNPQETPHWHFAQWDSFVNRTPARACLFGVLIGIAACLLLAVGACRRFTRANSACPVPFDQLRQKFDDVEERLAAVAAEAAADGGPSDPARRRGRPPWTLLAIVVCLALGRRRSSGGSGQPSSRASSGPGATALREAAEQRDRLVSMFAEPTPIGLRWLLATGYIDGWRRLHAIEAALMLVEPIPSVVRGALDDEMSLSGSSVPQSTALLKRVRTAVPALSVEASAYLIEQAPSATPQSTPSPTAPAGADAEDEARAALSQVRAAISQFRDGRREGLVRARNRLFSTVIFSGLTGCTLLFVAILSGASKTAVLAATVYYLIGGLVGLVKQLQSAATGATAAQDDYHLGIVRLIQTPLLAGLAAIGGVVLVKLGQGTQLTPAFLRKTFNLRMNPYGLVAAAFFGLTPSLLLSSLQQRVDQYRTDLSKSTPAESHGDDT